MVRGNSMFKNTAYFSAYYKDCDIFDKVAQEIKKTRGDIECPHIDIMINKIKYFSRTCNKEIFNLLSIFKNTMYDYRALWDEEQKYREKFFELHKKGYSTYDIDYIITTKEERTRIEEIHQQMNKYEDIMIQQLEKGYLMFLAIKEQGHWSIELEVLRTFISVCDVLRFNTRKAGKKARKEIEKRRIEKIVERHVEEKLSKIEKKLDKLLSKEI